MMNKVSISGITDLERAAKEFLSLIGDNKILAFRGSMGAGKTTFITALCAALQVEDVVNSPTFTIVNEYCTASKEAIFHFDFYRIESLSEVIDMGFEEYVYSGNMCFIEWPEMLEHLLPEEALVVNIKEIEDGTRVVEF